MNLRRDVLALLVCSSGAFASAQPGSTRTAAASYESLLKLRSTASVLHVTAHPDDEHGGVLTRLSRGEGVHVTLVSLTRGEAGANAIGPELFDALGLVRSEELILAGSYYGLDQLAFTRLADYGYSKRFEEARKKWPREQALRDLVLLIRKHRPRVILSRFQGGERDGHGQHHFAGWLATEAFEAAGDPEVFSDQLGELEPWRAKRLLLGGYRSDEPWHLAVSSHDFSPRLGTSFEELAREGLSLQRSQTGGRIRPVSQEVVRYYHDPGPNARRLSGMFEGIDTSLEALATDAQQKRALRELEIRISDTIRTFDWLSPSRSTVSLLDIRRDLDELLDGIGSATELRFELNRKLGQLDRALLSCLGVELSALAIPSGEPYGQGGFSRLPTLGAPSPGDAFDVVLRVSVGGQHAVRVEALELVAGGGWSSVAAEPMEPRTLNSAESVTRRLAVNVPRDAPILTPTVTRQGLAESIYTASDEAAWSAPRPPAAALASARLAIGDARILATTALRRAESRLPFGDRRPTLQVLPRVSVAMEPSSVLVPDSAGKVDEARFAVVSASVERHGARPGRPTRGSLRILAPSALTVRPTEVAFELGQAGERFSADFEIGLAASEEASRTERPLRLQAIATIETDEAEYTTGYRRIDHSDLELRYQIVPAETRVVASDVSLPPGMSVGYIMGAGDEVPQAVSQLGARVHLIGDDELASTSARELSAHDAIVIGTRAYAVRDALRRHNDKLLDYCEAGGNLVVLYNTPEFIPNRWAPYPAELPPDAEEVSEEDAPVSLLIPEHPVMLAPNRITARDFDGWLEQRGSKFWNSWDSRYEALVSSHDSGQTPQSGGWLHTDYGEGHYTYFAYAIHRQLPYGVLGAYRLLANLLSQGLVSGKEPGVAWALGEASWSVPDGDDPSKRRDEGR